MLSPETLEWLRQTARQGHSYSLAHLDHVERTDALRESLETALKRITALESFFERAEAAVDPLLAGGPLPAGATSAEREGGEVLIARPAPCSAAEADEPATEEPQALHSVALKMVDTLAQMGVLPEILDTLRRAIREPMAPAAAAATAAAPVATDAELIQIWGSFWLGRIRAVYNHGRAHGTPPAVVEALREAEVVLADISGGSPHVTDRASAALPAIRAALQQCAASQEIDR